MTETLRSSEVDDAALLTEAHSLADAVTVALNRCQTEVVSGLSAGSRPDHTVEQLVQSCGGMGAVFDGAYPDAIGRTRPTDQLLGEIARAAEDVDYLARELARRDSRNLDSAIDHIQRSVRDCLKVAASVKATERVRGMGPGLMPAPERADEEWARLLDNGRTDFGGLIDYIRRYAYNQGLHPEAVRDRMVRHFARAAEARLERVELLGTGPGLTPERKAYVDRSRGLVKVYANVVEAYTNGEVRTEDKRIELWTALTTADTAWREARVAALPGDGDRAQGQDQRQRRQ